jgi:hypothetical protein
VCCLCVQESLLIENVRSRAQAETDNQIQLFDQEAETKALWDQKCARLRQRQLQLERNNNTIHLPRYRPSRVVPPEYYRRVRYRAKDSPNDVDNNIPLDEQVINSEQFHSRVYFPRTKDRGFQLDLIATNANYVEQRSRSRDGDTPELLPTAPLTIQCADPQLTQSKQLCPGATLFGDEPGYQWDTLARNTDGDGFCVMPPGSDRTQSALFFMRHIQGDNATKSSHTISATVATAMDRTLLIAPLVATNDNIEVFTSYGALSFREKPFRVSEEVVPPGLILQQPLKSILDQHRPPTVRILGRCVNDDDESDGVIPPLPSISKVHGCDTRVYVPVAKLDRTFPARAFGITKEHVSHSKAMFQDAVRPTPDKELCRGRLSFKEHTPRDYFYIVKNR